MSAAELLAALEVPAAARVERRVPKTLLAEHGAPTAADRRAIADGVEEISWLAALKPTTIGVPEFRDEVREYLEIAVLRLTLRGEAKTSRLTELVHRAIPYPVVLLAELGRRVELSLAHKRWSQGEAGKVVLDGEIVSAAVPGNDGSGIAEAFRVSLALGRQPRSSLYALYDALMNALLALAAARRAGRLAPVSSPEHAAARKGALAECARLEAEMARLRSAASKERQMARRVELNLELQRLTAEHAAALSRL